MSDLSTLTNLIEEKGKAVHALQKSLEQREADVKRLGDVHTETKSQLDKANEAISELGEQKKAQEARIASLEAAARGSAAGGQSSKGADAVAEYKSAFAEYCKHGGNKRDVQLAAEKAAAACPEFKTLASNSASNGGLLVSPDTSGRIVTALHETSVMRQRASVQSSGSGVLKGSIRTGRANARWTGKLEQRTATGTPPIGQWSVTAHEVMAYPMISQEMLEDAVIDVEAMLQDAIIEEFSLMEEEAFYVGDGVGQPRGIITYTKDYTTDGGVIATDNVRTIKSGSVSTLGGADKIIELEKRIKSGYTRNAVYQGTREAIKMIRLMKQDNKFVWQDGLQAGEPDRLNGYAIDECNDLQAIANGAVPLIFGDLGRAYQIVDRLGIRTIRDEVTEAGFVKYNTAKRVGGGVVNFDCFAMLETAV